MSKILSAVSILLIIIFSVMLVIEVVNFDSVINIIADIVIIGANIVNVKINLFD